MTTTPLELFDSIEKIPFRKVSNEQVFSLLWGTFREHHNFDIDCDWLIRWYHYECANAWLADIPHDEEGHLDDIFGQFGVDWTMPPIDSREASSLGVAITPPRDNTTHGVGNSSLAELTIDGVSEWHRSPTVVEASRVWRALLLGNIQLKRSLEEQLGMAKAIHAMLKQPVVVPSSVVNTVLFDLHAAPRHTSTSGSHPILAPPRQHLSIASVGSCFRSRRQWHPSLHATYDTTITLPT